jgi:hypothetical protein
MKSPLKPRKPLRQNLPNTKGNYLLDKPYPPQKKTPSWINHAQHKRKLCFGKPSLPPRRVPHISPSFGEMWEI